MGTGTAPAKRKGNTQFRVLLIVWLTMFALGVFAGVTLTKKAFGMPAWVQRVLGLEPIIADIQSKATPLKTTPTIPSAPPVVQPKETAPAPPTQPTEVGKNDTDAQTPEPPADKPSPAESNTSSVNTTAPSGMSAAELDRKVHQYNDLLNRVKSAEKSFKTARKTASDNKNNPQEAEPALAQQQTDMEEIAGALQQAQTVLDELKRDPQFDAKYTEDTLALTLYPVPQFLKDTHAETLRFLKKRT